MNGRNGIEDFIWKICSYMCQESEALMILAHPACTSFT